MFLFSKTLHHFSSLFNTCDSTRFRYHQRIRDQFRVHKVCGVLGPRQCGKTTIALHYATTVAKENGLTVHHFDLENPDDLESLTHPMRTLENLEGLVIIDEIQRVPNLFPVLRVLADRQKAKYLILGSASRDLIRQSSESLAGRIGYVELTPFHLKEGCEANDLLIKGGFPLSYMADEKESYLWRSAYIQTFLERDIPMMGFSVPPATMRRFWLMLTHIHGQQLNLHQLGVSLGVSGHTIRSYLDILAGTFIVRILYPWYEDIEKRQTKTPKLYFRDSGLLLNLMRLSSYEELLHHPNLGSIWEGFALEQVIQALEIPAEEAFFWRTSHGAEIDLFVFYQGKRLGFEFKFSDGPKRTKSMMIALEDLKLDYLYVVYPGQREYLLDEKIKVIGINAFKENNF